MKFTEQFIKSLQNDPISGAIDICNATLKEYESIKNTIDSNNAYEVLGPAYYLLLELKETGLFNIDITFPELTGQIQFDNNKILPFISLVLHTCKKEATKLRVQSMHAQYRMTLGNSFAYEFSQGDLERVQVLVNELRDAISTSRNLEKEHQQRLLHRLEKLQTELHKKVSDLDRFWGLIGDAGVVLGKLGNDAKPIVDRIREIASIVWQTQSRTEELPSGTKLPAIEFKPPENKES